MSDKKPSPREITKQRIDRDKRALKRLDKKLKRLLGEHSPEWLEWVENKQKEITGELADADNWLKSATWKAAWDAGDLLDVFDEGLDRFQKQQGNKYDIKHDEAMDKLEDAMYDLVWQAGFDEDRVEVAAKDATEIVRQHLDDIERSWWDKLTNTGWATEFNIGDLLVKAELTLGTTELTAFEAITKLPELLWAALTVDLDTFIDKGMVFYDLQRKLAQRIQEEEIKRLS